MKLVNELTKSGLSVMTILLLSGCNASISIEDETDNPEPPIISPPTPEPVVVNYNPKPPAKSLNTTDLASLTITNLQLQDDSSGNLLLSWDESNAHSYRILFTANTGEFNTLVTSNNQASLTAASRLSGGQLFIESFDEFGNSVFSAPIQVGAIQ
ncbi:hypothetical protein [Catenovulum maritimum]|uniref:Fibronectin type-III domain-containing protein n=1 Tax=Catenovulum maritimum TaxID=1513271 RepID=A0A0J8H016_9ALTE|nr:hypothetical protein [Catenovulum maritimum]KMT66824.1 hypothetical protein XM47_01535 [Catenovulum maritimum]